MRPLIIWLLLTAPALAQHWAPDYYWIDKWGTQPVCPDPVIIVAPTISPSFSTTPHEEKIYPQVAPEFSPSFESRRVNIHIRRNSR
jgi:hypothetical protein